MIKWIKSNRETVIRNSFLFPILLVVIMSISHVVSWYDIGNPISWAIYLSIAVEIFALASVSAASIKMNKGSIWFLFILVTLIQLIGNVFYEYQEISLTDSGFLAWTELLSPFFEDWDQMDHRRFLAIIQGGTLPIMSLTSLHFYIKFNENLHDSEEKKTQHYFEARNKMMEDIVEAAKAEEEYNESNEPQEKEDDTEDETEYLLKSEANKEHLEESIEQIRSGETKELSQDELEYYKGIHDSSNISDPSRYINIKEEDRRISKGLRPQKNWGKK